MQVTHLLSGCCTGCLKLNYTVEFISSHRSYHKEVAAEFFDNTTRRVENWLEIRRCNLRVVWDYFVFLL